MIYWVITKHLRNAHYVLAISPMIEYLNRIKIRAGLNFDQNEFDPTRIRLPTSLKKIKIIVNQKMFLC